MQRKELKELPREELIARAEKLGVNRPSALTEDELLDAIERRSAPEPPRSKGGWFGRARDLLTSVIDRGLGLPASRVEARRNDTGARPGVVAPLPTVTLAEIYAAQGHLERAVATLDEVIARDPQHPEAPTMRARFAEQLRRTRPSTPPSAIEARLVPVGADGVLYAADPSSDDAATDAPAATADALGEPGAAEAPTLEPATTDAAAADLATNRSSSLEGALTGDVPLDEAAIAVEPATSAAATEPSFEIDEVVALAVDPSTVYLYWEIRPATLAAARVEHPSGALVVRVLEVVPGAAEPSSEARDTRVDALHGELFVRGLRAGAQVRVSVGWLHEGVFEPLAVGDDLSTPRTTPAPVATRTVRKWSDAGGPIARADEAMLEAFRPSRPIANAPPRRDEEALTARYPASVWIEPSERLVQVVERGAVETRTEERTHTAFVRLPGSSELVRREWTEARTDTTRWPDRASAWSLSSHASG